MEFVDHKKRAFSLSESQIQPYHSSMKKTCIAHTGEKGHQSLRDHLVNVADKTSRMTRKLNVQKAGELIGLLHDLGKCSNEFQEYIYSFDPSSGVAPKEELRGKIDHSTAGAQAIVELLEKGKGEHSLEGLVARMLALCIASHHSGLIDCLLPDGGDGLNQRLRRLEEHSHSKEAWERLEDEVRRRALDLVRDPQLIAELQKVVGNILHGNDEAIGDRNVQLGLFLRMLFSCLIDADRTDTADFESPAGGRFRQIGQYETWEQLISRLHEELARKDCTSGINRLRRSISDQCFAAAARAPGIYTLTVPTGGGKTLAALRFALEHARRHGMDRVIFVSPYISIIDQNADVARRILEPEDQPFASIVLEHHSNLPEEKDTWRQRILAENWDAPVVFTTAVQVLEALFGSGTRPVRRLHAMARAVIVFDEVQTLPVRMVHLFNNAINLLVSQCGSTVLLCTATQPLLHTVDPAKGAARLAAQSELIEEVPALFRSLRRYDVFDETARPGGWTHDAVAELVCKEARTYGSCLAVVNTKRDAGEIFAMCRERMGENAHVVHLSTAMVPAHRTEVIERLKAELVKASPDRPVVCVSTQLIEAGVDIDSATVVRDLAGLDSVAQAAGRCNRHDTRPEPGRVHIVELRLDSAVLKWLPDIKIGRDVARRILDRWRRENPGQRFPLDQPEQITEYYRHSFHERRSEMSYDVPAKDAGRDTTLLDLLGNNTTTTAEAKRIRTPLKRNILLQSFQTANKAFALIGATQGIVVPFREAGKEIVNELNRTADFGAEWQLLRKAQPYTLSVYASQFKQLERSGAIYPIEGAPGVWCLRAEFYDSVSGLQMEPGLMENLIAS